MTNVFKKIPDGFFKILTSKHRELYLETIFHIDDLLQGNIYISRSRAIDSLQDHYAMLGITMKELSYEDEYEEIKTVRSLAQSVLRQLEKRGWISVILEDGFVAQVSFPGYANRFIQLLRDIDSNETDGYSGYVLATYSSLKTGLDEKGNLLLSLKNAWDSTKGLQRAIQIAYHELTVIYAKIVDELTTSEMLSQHFSIYKQEIIDQILYPLKTRDSLPRFKNSILNLLTVYSKEENVELMVSQSLNESYEESEKKISTYLTDLIEFYRNVNSLIDIVDNKKTEYTEKSISKIQYRLRSDYQLKDKIDRLIDYVKNEKDTEFFDLANIVSFQLIDSSSLFERRKKRDDISTKARKKVDVSKGKEFSREQYEFFKEIVNHKYSSRKVDQYILSLLKNRKEISTLEYQIITHEDFILTIMGAIRGYEKNSCGYDVAFEQQYIRNGYYKLPKMIFRREELNV